MNKKRKTNASCSFCRKYDRDVGPLVEGPGEAYICGGCVDLCQSIIVQENHRRRPEERSSKPSPLTIHAKLARIVPGRDEVTRALVEAAVYHYFARLDRGRRSLILLIGPTRSSKLFLARALAHALEVPFAEADVRILAKSPTQPAMAPVYQLLSSADYDAEAAQRGIVFLDGIDDRASQAWLPVLWKQMENDAGTLQFPNNIDDLLFLCGGEFAAIDQVAVEQGGDPEKPLTAEKLRALGMATDLVDRLAAIVKVAPVDEKTLERMATSVDFSQLAGDDEAKDS